MLLIIMAVLLLTYGAKSTDAYLIDGKNSTDNVLRVKTAPLFGIADSFVILAGSTVANTGNSTVTGDLGLSPGTSVTGFPPGTVIGTQHSADAAAAQAKLDLTTAYNDAAGRTAVTVGTELGGTSPLPGIYTAGTFGLTGTLTLTGDVNSVWIFHTTSTLNTAGSSQVVLSGGARAANVYWVVESSATLGANSIFKGNIMAYASITLYSGAAVEGRVFAETAAVTLNANTIIKP